MTPKHVHFLKLTEVYVNSPALNKPPSDSPPENRVMMLTLWAVLFSPISLWGPVLFGILTYGVLRGRTDVHLR
jgi:hypothetical protein